MIGIIHNKIFCESINEFEIDKKGIFHSFTWIEVFHNVTLAEDKKILSMLLVESTWIWLTWISSSTILFIFLGLFVKSMVQMIQFIDQHKLIYLDTVECSGGYYKTITFVFGSTWLIPNISSYFYIGFVLQKVKWLYIKLWFIILIANFIPEWNIVYCWSSRKLIIIIFAFFISQI